MSKPKPDDHELDELPLSHPGDVRRESSSSLHPMWIAPGAVGCLARVVLFMAVGAYLISFFFTAMPLKQEPVVLADWQTGWDAFVQPLHPHPGVMFFAIVHYLGDKDRIGWSGFYAIAWMANPVFWLGLWRWNKRPDWSGTCGIVALSMASLLVLRKLVIEHQHGHLPDGRDQLGSGYYLWLSSMALLAIAGILHWATRPNPWADRTRDE